MQQKTDTQSESSNRNAQSILKKLGINQLNAGSCISARQWAGVDGAALIKSYNPANGQLLAEITAAKESDYQALMQASLENFERWRLLPAPRRGEFIRQIAEQLREHKDLLGSLVSLETGKIKQEGDGEVQEMIDIADFAVGQSRMLYGKTMHSERAEHRMYEQWHPLGPVAVISSFNFPVAVWAWNAFIAAIGGNTVIWKPSPKAPLCAVAVQHLCNQVMAQSDFDSVFTLYIPEQNQLVESLVRDTRIPLVSFTGSSAVGRRVGTWVAERMGRSLLELSGNNALIIDQTANLELAIPAVVFGFIGTSGQRCTSTRRLFVHEQVYDEVKRRLCGVVNQIKIGDPLDDSVLMGPLIDQQAVNSYNTALEQIRAAGCEMTQYGQLPVESGNYVLPVIVETDNSQAFVQRETFAPILYLMRFNELHEAIKAQNSVAQGLSSSLFTDSLRHAELFLSAAGSDCGIANINIGTSGAEIGGAFGGEKETGGGREAGSDSWKAYMRRQTNTINWGAALPLAQGIEFNINE